MSTTPTLSFLILLHNICIQARKALYSCELNWILMNKELISPKKGCENTLINDIDGDKTCNVICKGNEHSPYEVAWSINDFE